MVNIYLIDQYIGIIKEFASLAKVSIKEAIDFFYTSRMFNVMEDEDNAFVWQSEGYIANNLYTEYKLTKLNQTNLFE